MTAGTTIGVDDDFTTGETGVTLRSADDELAGGVDEELGVLGDHLLRDDFFDDPIDTELFDRFVINISGVLGRNDDVDDAGGLAIDIFDSDLGLGVRAEPFGEASSFTNLGELTAETVGEHDGGGHELGSLITGVAKHDALVTSTLLGGFFTFCFLGIYSLSDVSGLGGEKVADEDFVGVENIVVIGVANSPDGITDGFFYVDGLAEGLCSNFWNSDFTTDDDLVGLYESLAGNAGVLING